MEGAVTLKILLFYLGALTVSVEGQGFKSINDFLFSGNVQFYDLTHAFNNESIYWPGHRKLAFVKKYEGERSPGKWYSANEFCAAEHGGTHIDAPYHISQSGWKLGQIPFKNLITPLHVVDLSNVVRGNPDFVLQRSHMDHLFHLDPRRNHTVLFRFGWSQFYGDPEKYLGSAHPTRFNLRFPGISEDVARWLVSVAPNIVGVGVDTASIDAGAEVNAPAHRVFAERNIFMLENVKIDRDLPINQCAIFVLPMNIEEGSGAPCGLTAVCPRVHADGFF